MNDTLKLGPVVEAKIPVTVEVVPARSPGGDPLPDGSEEDANGPNGPVSPWSSEGRA